MVKDILHPLVQEFILKNVNADEKQLILKYKEFHNVPIRKIVDQILGRRKSKNKLPTFYKNSKIVFPPGLNLEQSSSESTALFKTEFLKTQHLELNVLADLTGGFGIDTFFLSKIFQYVHSIEPNENLIALAQHNHHELGARNITYHNITALEFLSKFSGALDLIYLDPDRRTTHTRKSFKLNESEPNIIIFLDQLLRRAPMVMIKTSPLLDIHQAQRELANIKLILVVSVNNECKEILFLCQRNYDNEPKLKAINLIGNDTKQEFEYYASKEKEISVTFSEPLKYIYEPNSSILKAGAFKTIASEFNLLKLDTHTHFYTSNTLIQSFPGRIFKIDTYVKPDKKSIQKFLPDLQANITTRNYPLSVAEIKKKTNLKDGGLKYILGFTAKSKRYLAIADRII